MKEKKMLLLGFYWFVAILASLLILVYVRKGVSRKLHPALRREHWITVVAFSGIASYAVASLVYWPATILEHGGVAFTYGFMIAAMWAYIAVPGRHGIKRSITDGTYRDRAMLVVIVTVCVSPVVILIPWGAGADVTNIALMCFGAVFASILQSYLAAGVRTAVLARS